MKGELTRQSLPKFVRKAIVSSLSIVLFLAAIQGLFFIHDATTSTLGAQITLTTDQQVSATVRIAIQMNAWIPPFHTLADEPMVCNGTRLSFTHNVPNHSFGGYFGDVPTVSSGNVYHCIYHYWNKDVTLTIPAPASTSLVFNTSLKSGSVISIHQPFRFTYQVVDAGNTFFPTAQATDTHNHFTEPASSYYNQATGGSVIFHAVAPKEFTLGSGTIYVFSQSLQSQSQAGWDSGITVIYQNGVSIPISWIA